MTLPRIVSRVWTKCSWQFSVAMVGYGALPREEQLAILDFLHVPHDRQVAVVAIVFLIIRSIQQKP